MFKIFEMLILIIPTSSKYYVKVLTLQNPLAMVGKSQGTKIY